MVEIKVNGETHLLKDADFKDLMYSARCQADTWYYNNSKMDNDDLAYRWLDIMTTAIALEDLIDDSGD